MLVFECKLWYWVYVKSNRTSLVLVSKEHRPILIHLLMTFICTLSRLAKITRMRTQCVPGLPLPARKAEASVYRALGVTACRNCYIASVEFNNTVCCNLIGSDRFLLVHKTPDVFFPPPHRARLIVILQESGTEMASRSSTGDASRYILGQDNLVRVVTLKTAQGVYKRPVSKIAILYTTYGLTLISFNT